MVGEWKSGGIEEIKFSLVCLVGGRKVEGEGGREGGKGRW